MSELFTNNGASTLAASVGTSDTSISLKSGDGSKFPSPTSPDFFRLVLFKKSTGETEIVKVTARSADVLTVNRAQEGTTALALAAGDIVELRPTAGFLQSLSVTSLNLQEQAATYAADSGTANTYAATYSPAITALSAGMRLSFLAANANTGASTFDAGPGAIDIKKNGAQALEAGDIPSGRIITVEYDGTNWVLVPRQVPTAFGSTLIDDASATEARNTLQIPHEITDLSTKPALTSGTATAYTAILGETALETNRVYRIRPHADSTGKATLDLDGLGAATIKTVNGYDVKAGHLKAGMIAELRWDGTNFVLLNPYVEHFMPAGGEMFWPSATPPVGFLEEDGSAVSMTVYEALYDVIGGSFGLNAGAAFTADATTDVFTAASHGMSDGDVLEVSNTGGALPAGLSANTKYFVITATASTFQLSATRGGAAIDVTDTGTGTHSFHNQFLLPDARGEFIRVWDNGAGVDPDAGTRTDRGDGTTGDNVGTKQADENKSHQHGTAGAHTHTAQAADAAGSTHFGPASVDAGTYTISNIDSAGAHQHPASGGNESRPRNTTRMLVIKY